LTKPRRRQWVNGASRESAQCRRRQIIAGRRAVCRHRGAHELLGVAVVNGADGRDVVRYWNEPWQSGGR